ncbi:zf-CCHC domain-containing protein/UBN2 domain-containing protein [Gossypium australe]|uniref:Zf-CCHC domain-containing protein/UBN2 domain-containing protein n=1 Tax=Gossypium australe TaxID=47621 RepID=A0A5B6VKD3_9ROSI|nr:zf-CCHC domain-containing protein/UBN2 domain-containing protein [Gossypium australe]
MDGPSIPLKQERELVVRKSKNEWDEEYRRSTQLNVKAMHTLFCELGLTNIMKPEEDIKTMSDHFTIIINGLKSYGKIYPNEKVEAKVTAIEEAKNLETLALDELISSLLIHEMRLNERIEEEKDEDSESSEVVDVDKEMVVFCRRFKMFMKSNKGRRFQKKEGLKLESTKEKDPVICYECKKSGHIKFYYPQ